jgi:molybdate transport system ATP-binding protein
MAVQMKPGAEQHEEIEQRGTGMALEVTVRKSIPGKGGPPFVLDVRFEAQPGVTVLFGPSGSGKTTILDCIAGLTRPDWGRMAIGTRVLFDSDSRIDVPTAKRRTGYVFQNLALFPHLTVAQNVQYGIASSGPGERRRRTDEFLESFRIAHLRNRRPGDISGGECQRVALARALVVDPCALLLDEPFSGLDLATKSRIVDDLRSWNQQHQVPILFVTHDRAEVFALAERVIVLEQGGVLAEGNPLDVLQAPRQELTAQLSGIENVFDATVQQIREDHGTMTCTVGPVELEVPLARVENGSEVRIGIRAGDILLAAVKPQGLSARNIIPGRVVALHRRDMMMVALVECGTTFEVHLTPYSQIEMGLVPGREVWLVVKTHSCHLLAR